MIYTEDNYGMDGKAKLPRLPANNSWQGLEDLYRVNESIYAYRQNYRLSLADWTHYLKDVDRVFALLNSHFEQKKANKTKTAPSLGLPGISGELPVPPEMASAQPDADPSPAAEEAPHVTLPADLRTLPWNQSPLDAEDKLEWNNDIPEVSRLHSEHWSRGQTENRERRENIHPLEPEVSGNGLTELAVQPSPRPQLLDSSREEPPQEGGPEGDVFEDQLYLPVHSSGTPVHLTAHAASPEQPVQYSQVGRPLNAVEKNSTQDSSQHLEGSASTPLPSD